MGSFGGKSPAGSTTTTSSPWAGAVPYLTGQNAYGQNAGVPGTMPSAANLYQNSGWSPAMANQATGWQNWLGAAGNSINGMGNTGTAMANGSLTPNINAVSGVTGSQVNAPTVNVGSSLNAMGAVDPTQSIQQLLSGQVSPGMTNSIGNEANAMYGQATQNLMQQVMPQLNEQAIGAGGYGGSRQGIAQGLALSNMQQNLAPSIAGLYNNANQTAQGLQGSTANNMAGLGTTAGLANASNSLTAQQANQANALAAQQISAQIALQNNAQSLQANQLGTANRLAGSQMANQAYTMGNQNQQTGMTLTQAPNQYNWQNLGNYTGVIDGTAGLGGSQSQPYFQNSAANIASTGLTGLLGYNMLTNPAMVFGGA